MTTVSVIGSQSGGLPDETLDAMEMKITKEGLQNMKDWSMICIYQKHLGSIQFDR